ncbi:hypothetical protein [Enterovirga sp.]|uniref:hypothetical protein n=1 Tax=Enterovirga sp. TaxID=2026350 RepID=UPI0026307EF0|nr:hypothetical protein [Enterovirga sp.]MDB5589838.1 hypothetical protein [Enterovirga sp.]
MAPAASRPDPAGPALFRPDPVLAVGIVGEDCDPGFVAELAPVLATLSEACGRIVARDAEFFSGARPRIRLVVRAGSAEVERGLAEILLPIGGELGLIGAGEPRPTDEGARVLWLPGPAGDPDVAAERADALLDQSDLLLASWDGQPDARPGSAGAILQEAVERRLPVLLRRAGGPVQVVDDPAERLLPALAARLPRVGLADNLEAVLARAFAPPSGPEERQALRDCLAEPGRVGSRRPEYPAFLLLAARPRPSGEDVPGLGPAEEWARAEQIAGGISPEAASGVAGQARRHARMEQLAAFYGRRARSGTVLRYSGPAFGALMIAVLAIVAPQMSLGWLGVQAVVMTLTITEAAFATRGRWSERWLDYRSLGERLRCDRFLLPLGIGLGRLEVEGESADPAWMRWCHRRLRRAEVPAGVVSDEVVRQAFRHLAEVEIAGQIRYHESAALRFRSLSRRLRQIAAGSVLCIAGASLALFGQGLLGAGAPGIEAVLLALLITLPSVFLAARGLRLEGAFDLAAARSEQTLAALRRLRDRMGAGPLSYGRLVQASRAAAGAMVLETGDWRIGVQRSRTPYRASPPTAPAEAPRGASRP